MKKEQLVKALKNKGFEVHLDNPLSEIVASEGIHYVSLSKETVDDAPVEWVVGKVEREIARLKEVAQ